MKLFRKVACVIAVGCAVYVVGSNNHLHAEDTKANATAVKCEGEGTWCVRRDSMAKTCRVQKTTAAPIGTDFLGEFATRADAVKAMCKAYDPDKEDPNKCWEMIPSDECR